MADELLSPSTSPFSHPERVELRETHISRVFLTETYAFKQKKPVDFGFLDYSSIEKRHAACQAELELNAELAPGVYLAVIPLRRNASGKLTLGEQALRTGELVDWLVQMRRLPDGCRADQLLADSRLGRDEIERLGIRVARFHATALTTARTDGSIRRFGEPAVLKQNMEENFDQTRESLPLAIGTRDAEKLRDSQREFQKFASDRFTRRVTNGKIRDGHGDLRLEQIYFLETGITLLDRIEFNDRFRYADVCADLAFLSMDLRFNGSPDLAELLLSVYARESGDYDLYGLINYYESYRAFVRGKVATLRGRLSDLLEAKRYFQLALSLIRQQRAGAEVNQPMVFAVGGLIGTGKSTLSEAMSRETGIPVVSTDRTRNTAPGIWQGVYSPAAVRRVYQEVFREAGVILDSGRSVIIDASFRTQQSRLEARALARSRRLGFRFLECRADIDVCRRRLAERVGTEHESEATAELLEPFLKSYEPVTELPEQEYACIDTEVPREESLRYALQETHYQAIRKLKFETG